MGMSPPNMGIIVFRFISAKTLTPLALPKRRRDTGWANVRLNIEKGRDVASRLRALSSNQFPVYFSHSRTGYKVASRPKPKRN